MDYPTDAEIAEAHKAIITDGPTADITMALSLLVRRNTILRGAAQNMASVVAPNDMLMEAVVTGALVAGLNLGLRIAEMRIVGSRETVQ